MLIPHGGGRVATRSLKVRGIVLHSSEQREFGVLVTTELDFYYIV